MGGRLCPIMIECDFSSQMMHSSQMIECANKTLDPFDFKKLNVRHSILSNFENSEFRLS